MALAEGSAITLNTDSAIEPRLDKAIRRIRLLQGEALFEVAKDLLRPFVVLANDVQVRAIGTAFTVRLHEQGEVTVMVREGVVEVPRIDAGLPRQGRRAIGDGWLRLMTFDMEQAAPVVRVRTYSPHYKGYSTDLPDYAKWYKSYEKPTLSDADFLQQDDFSISLNDFQARFGKPKK